MLIRSHSHIAAGVLLLTIITLVAACREQNVYAPPPPPEVTVSKPALQSVTDYVEFTGNTQAIKTVQLVARVQGYLEKVLFQDGDRVKEGQLLFLIEQDAYEAQLKQAEAQILQQKANLDHAQIEFVRFGDLLRKNAASQTDVDNWRFQRDNYRAAVLAAEAARDLARLNLSYTRVTAPFDGRIGRRLVDPGNLVGAGGNTVLTEINQVDPIYVYFTINEADLLRLIRTTGVSPGEAQRMKIPVYLGLANEKEYPHQGYLDFTGIAVTPTTGTLLLRGIFPNPDGVILPGLFARLRGPVVGSEKTALLVPEVALGYDQQGSYVLVVDDKNTVERRSVKVGTQVDDRRVIQEGVKGDEWVIISGLLRAIPGSQVTPVRKPFTGAADSSGSLQPITQSGKSAP
jgi:RND family efflux transporter MFP subunit